MYATNGTIILLMRLNLNMNCVTVISFKRECVVVDDDTVYVRSEAADESVIIVVDTTTRCKRQWNWRKGVRTACRNRGREDAIAVAVALAQRTQHSLQSCGL